MTFKKSVKNAISMSMQPLCDRVCRAASFVPVGHYYSPISNEEDFRTAYGDNHIGVGDWVELESRNNSAAGIDFNEVAQLELLGELGKNYQAMPLFPADKEDEFRFHFGNHYYSYPDATVFYCMLSSLRPRRIVDVGGGYTTTLMLDMNDICFADRPMEITLIEPYPDRIQGVIGKEDDLEQLYCKVQDVDPKVFRSLEAGDVLFLDTTHVSKTGSEVNYLIFNVFPMLQPGVIIHIHEVFYPFEYPRSFYNSAKSWNELFLWRAFLMHNHSFEILFFNSWLAKKHPEALAREMPGFFTQGDPAINVQTEGSSLWLRKCG